MTRILRRATLWAVVLAMAVPAPSAAEGAGARRCEAVAAELNVRVHGRLDVEELASILRALNRSGGATLPAKFITKGQARRAGWRPGGDLWRVPGLRGRSLGGDRFANREGKVSGGSPGWREADLGYKGGRRGPQRLVYRRDGRRAITVDHYVTFLEVSACR